MLILQFEGAVIAGALCWIAFVLTIFNNDHPI
jgi:hypothetical protein